MLETDLALSFAIITSSFINAGLDSGWYKKMVFIIQFSTLANIIWFRSILFQDSMHTAFVFLMVYGSFGKKERPVAVFCNGSMLVLRCRFNKCVFLWWNTGRNLWNDALGLLLFISGFHIKINNQHRLWIALVAAGASHFASEPR